VQRAAIIVAGGSGKRMGAEVPKQFLLLKGKPVLYHTLKAFHSFDPLLQIALVLPSEHHDTWRHLCAEHDLYLPHGIVNGGEERWHSVKAGLQQIEMKEGVVAVHDGVRPLISVDLISCCFDHAERTGSAIPVVPISSSIRRVQGDHSEAIDRTQLRAVQTPQCFRMALLRKAFELPFDRSFTDEATMIERLGGKVELVEGEERNIKITTPIDLKVAEALM
jgi:2-C-methyl-D-erythritol 4-phosphate cytidylyltransferase